MPGELKQLSGLSSVCLGALYAGVRSFAYLGGRRRRSDPVWWVFQTAAGSGPGVYARPTRITR